MRTATAKNPVVIGDLMKLAMAHLNNAKNGEQKPHSSGLTQVGDEDRRIGNGKNDIHKFLNAA